MSSGKPWMVYDGDPLSMSGRYYYNYGLAHGAVLAQPGQTTRRLRWAQLVLP